MYRLIICSVVNGLTWHPCILRPRKVPDVTLPRKFCGTDQITPDSKTIGGTLQKNIYLRHR